MNDPEYSPAFQEEYRRLWHEAAAARDAYKIRYEALDDAIRESLDVVVLRHVADFEGRLATVEKILNDALEKYGAQLPVEGEPTWEEWYSDSRSHGEGQ